MNCILMRTHLFTKSSVLICVTLWSVNGIADFVPILLTSDSYNYDVVVEKTAPPPVVPVTTASMETGLANTGFSWFERGYFADWPASGLPEAGTILTSDAAPDHRYQFASSYQSNNVILLDSSLVKGTMTLSKPSAYSSLSVLTSSGGGDRTIINYTVHFQDGSAESGSFTSPSWIGGASPAWSADGRINVTTFTYDMFSTDNPRLYSVDINLTNRTSSVTGVDFSYAKGLGHSAIFALSGATETGGEFSPITVTGYNQDIVVEASAIKPEWLDLYTTATMENGTVNARRSWYEAGYYPLAPETGLPPAGASFASRLAPDHVYRMAPSYTNNNAVLIDAAVTSQQVTFVNRSRYAALSLLTAAGHGPVTTTCVVLHTDGSCETNEFVSPDWLGSAPAAFTANGCVSISTKLVTSLNSGFPRLFSVDMPLTQTNSPVAGLTLMFKAGGNDSHAVIFAVSGAVDLVSPVTAPRLSIRRNQDGTLSISSDGPGRLQSTSVLQGLKTVWHDESPIAQNAPVTLLSAEAVKFYRVLAQ